MGSLTYIRIIFLISIVSAMFLGLILILKPATYRQHQFLAEVISDYSKKESEIKKNLFFAKLKRIVLDLFPPNENKVKKIDKLLRDLRMTRSKDAMDLIFNQYFSIFYLIGGVFILASPEIFNLDISYHMVTGLLGPLIIYAGYKRWVNTVKVLKDELALMEYHFEKDLATIFNLFYSRLKESSGYPLLDIVEEIKPNVTGPSLRVLDILIVDIKMKGEMGALANLSNRFKSPYITKTANLLANRLRGLDNVVEMEEFIGKLRMHRDFLLKDILKTKNKRVEKIKTSLMLPAFSLIILKLLAMVMQNLGKV